jgi:hypothetical protein
MTFRQTSSKPQVGSAQPQYSDIERWNASYAKHCAGCGGEAAFVLKDDQGNALAQCSNCLATTFRDDPEMTARVLRAVAERL